MRIFVIEGDSPYFRLLAWGLREAGHDVRVGSCEELPDGDAAVILNAAPGAGDVDALRRRHTARSLIIVQLRDTGEAQLDFADASFPPPYRLDDILSALGAPLPAEPHPARGTIDVARALDPARSFHGAISAALALACDAIHAAHAAVWTPSPENGELHCIALHQQLGEQMSPFRTATMRRAFRPGIELPGSIWASERPEWIPDVTRERRFVRAFAADSCGIGTGAGFPMRIDGALAAVIEFMFLGQVTPTGAMISFIEEFASTLGTYIKETRARRALRAGEERFLFILERPEDLAFRWRYQPLQHCTYVSPAVAAIFGYPRDAWYADPRFMSRAVLDEDRPLLEDRLAHPEVTDPLVLRLRSAAGDVVWTEQHTFPVYDDADLLLSLDGRTRIILPQTSWGVMPDVPSRGH